MNGVQLVGKDCILEAFNDTDCDTWAILQGKQLVIAGQGEDRLVVWLDRFSRSGSTATLILRCYDTDSEPDSLTAATNYCASFNIKLLDTYEGSGISGYSNKLAGRIDALEKRLDDGGDEGNDVMSSIMGWLQEPHKLQQVVGAFKMLIGGAGVSGGPAGMPAPQGMAGFSQQGDPQERVQRLAAALDRLEKKDPKIVEHLEKLADVAEKNTDTFNFLISNLERL